MPNISLKKSILLQSYVILLNNKVCLIQMHLLVVYSILVTNLKPIHTSFPTTFFFIIQKDISIMLPVTWNIPPVAPSTSADNPYNLNINMNIITMGPAGVGI